MELRFQVDDDFAKSLKERLDYSNYTELARDALTLLDWASQESKEGRLILSAEPGGANAVRLALARLDVLRSKSKK